MTDEEFVYHETNRERKRNGYGDFHKKKRGGKHVRLPSDHMTKKEWKKMNGDIMTYKLDVTRTWAEYKALPDYIKADYLTHLVSKYSAGNKMIAKMLGISASHVWNEKKRLGLDLQMQRGTLTKTAMDKWDKFLHGDEPEFFDEAECATVPECVTVSGATISGATIDTENESVTVCNPAEDIAFIPFSQPKTEIKLAPDASAKGKIAELIAALCGTGAKVTIELVL